MKRIYLDNCCYNRPYDDQTQVRISLESQAKLEIQRMIKEQQVSLVTSYMNTYENNKNPDENKRNAIQRFQDENSYIHISSANLNIVDSMAEQIESTGIKYKDACHIACAILGKCDCFITTDDRLYKYQDPRIQIINPIQFFTQEADEK